MRTAVEYGLSIGGQFVCRTGGKFHASPSRFSAVVLFERREKEGKKRPSSFLLLAPSSRRPLFPLRQFLPPATRIVRPPTQRFRYIFRRQHQAFAQRRHVAP